MVDSQPSLGSGRASHPNRMINSTAPGELEETIEQFMLPEPLPHPLISILSMSQNMTPDRDQCHRSRTIMDLGQRSIHL